MINQIKLKNFLNGLLAEIYKHSPDYRNMICKDLGSIFEPSKRISRPDIIHKQLLMNNKQYYLCNQAITPTKQKLTANDKKVTCNNCKKILNIIN